MFMAFLSQLGVDLILVAVKNRVSRSCVTLFRHSCAQDAFF